MLGYPEDGPFDVRPARVRDRERISGRDIYGQLSVDRDIYTIRSVVRSGNSGGPLIATDGSHPRHRVRLRPGLGRHRVRADRGRGCRRRPVGRTDATARNPGSAGPAGWLPAAAG